MFHIHRLLGRMFAAALLAIVCVAFAPQQSVLAAPVTARIIDIASARALPLGSTVTVQGSVTVPSGAFQSSSFDQGFAVQDRTGGIYVLTATNLGLAPRQQVRVSGHLVEGFGELILVVDNPADVKTLGTGPKVSPQPFATGEISEATEGLLVKVAGTITRPVINDLPFGFEVFIDDGSGETQVFVSASTGIDVSGLAAGQQIQVIGLSSQFADQYEIRPRSSSDIQVQ
jgi:DNA/RNA endonuclease YhcR with UshA esterase domain